MDAERNEPVRLEYRITVPLWAPLLMLVLPTALFWWRDRRFAPGRCPACGYDLTGLPAPAACPECGGMLKACGPPAADALNEH